jgi:electron transfer flavoprotein alpha subunit
MSVLVIAEISKGKVKKASLEATNYAFQIANQLSKNVTALIIGEGANSNIEDLGKAGASKILFANDKKLESGDAKIICTVISDVMSKENADVIIFSHDFNSKNIAPYLAAKVNAGIVPATVDFPIIENGSFLVKKNVFSGKANATYKIDSAVKILCLLPNSFPVELDKNKEGLVEQFNCQLEGIESKIKIRETKKSSDSVNLPEAELVVSAGRGLKGPENWGIIEELATELGAATACSRPVSDIGWRPHHEHVGQTGIAIRPNLYIAIGISGAIQHLAGVNGSKTIVVINKDPEAPFFKSADYGIVGDAFEIVPKITQALKNFKSSQH